MPIDRPLAERLTKLIGVLDAAHAREHEVHLPFLQMVLGEFDLVPIIAGEVGGILEALWGGCETTIVVTTDLSHYRPYAEAAARDQQTSAAIVAKEPGRIADIDACGAYGLRGLLGVARQRRLEVEQLDLRNSGDTAGSRDRVVDYSSWALFEPSAQQPTEGG